MVQGNCILALSGLAVVLSRHESTLPAQSDGQVEVRKLLSVHAAFLFVLQTRGGNTPLIG